MAIVRWDPFRDLMNIQERVNRLLSDSPGRWGEDEGYGSWIPPVDVFERGDQLVIRAEIPGVRQEDIDIQVENGVLVLRGQRKREEEIQERSAFRLERVFGAFTRSFSLPTTVDAAKIGARLRDGVIEITLPKAEAAKPKKVTIQAE